MDPAPRVAASSALCVCPEGKFLDAQLSFSSSQNFPVSYLIFFLNVFIVVLEMETGAPLCGASHHTSTASVKKWNSAVFCDDLS